MMCAQRDRGRAGEKEKTGHRAREPQRGCCAATNVKLSESMSAERWMTHLHNGFDLPSLSVTLVFPVDVFSQFFMVLFMWIVERDNGQNYLKIAVIILFSCYSLKDCGDFYAIIWNVFNRSCT